MYDSLVLLFSNYGSQSLYPFLEVGGNGGRGRTRKKQKLKVNGSNTTESGVSIEDPCSRVIFCPHLLGPHPGPHEDSR